MFIAHKQNYGSPRIYNALAKAGIVCSENRVARLMRLNNLAAVNKRKFRVTTNSNHKYPVAPNLLQRKFTIDVPNKVWVSDITYIWTFEGWLYLAFVLDLYSRSVVGLAMADKITDGSYTKRIKTGSTKAQAAQRTNTSL